jgi:hypothetical protein
MDIANTLLTFSQVAIGLAGFAAILIALSGKPHQWTPVDAFRIRNILAFSFESVFLSLVPFVLTFFSVREARVWQLSLWVLALASFGGVVQILAGVYRMSHANRAVLKYFVISSVTIVLSVMTVIELLAACGVIGPPSAVFFLGLVMLLGVSAVLVARFLFARPAD